MTAYPNVLVRSEHSDGRVSVIESLMPAGATGPPLHTHAFDEAFYVLDGELTYQLDEEFGTAAAGELAFARGVDPPDWALQPIPEVTKVGPPIGGE